MLFALGSRPQVNTPSSKHLAGVKHAVPLGAGAATVMSWAGMRGVVTLAVALTLPEAMPGRGLMRSRAFRGDETTEQVALDDPVVAPTSPRPWP